MKYFPIHILVKDAGLFLLVAFFAKGPVDFDVNMWVLSFWTLRAVVVTDLIVQTIGYLTVRHYLIFTTWKRQFIVGAMLHVPALIYCGRLMIPASGKMVVVLVLFLSTTVSAVVYILLNNDTIWHRRKPEDEWR